MSNDEVSYRKGGENGYVGSQFNAPEGYQVAYQTEEGGFWKYANCPVKGGRIPGAKLVTTTANKPQGENEPPLQVGDFMIDIDREYKINEACQAAVLIADYLMSLGLHQDDIHIWFSGSKGVHIRIPRKCFEGAI